jgi:membrane protease YdiL (CAAX protease family)
MYIAQGWLRVIVAMILWMFVTAFFHFAGSELLQRSWTEPLETLSMDEHLMNISLSLMATLVTLYFCKKFIDRGSFEEMGVTSLRSGQLFGAGALVGIIVIASGFLILLQMNEIVPARNEVSTVDMVKGVLLYLLVALNEELLTRGYVQVNFSRSFNRYAAILLTSCVFAFLHIFNMGITNIGLLNLMLSGILLGVNFLFIRNIWYSVGLHFSWNYVQGFIFGFHVSGNNRPSLLEVNYYHPNLWNGGAFGFEGSLICTILSAGAIIAMYFYFRKYAKLTGSEIPAEKDLQAQNELS